MEKARTVPDSYPLTLNSLMLGCNQKTSRDPLMELDEAQVASAIDTLKSTNLVRETSGGRSTRYEHNFQRGVGVFEQAAVLLGLLMLRGPQTAGELRLNSERWYKFADISSVEGFLEELQDRATEKGGPLVVKLSRAPGTREQRWAHLLCGEVALPAVRAAAGDDAGGFHPGLEKTDPAMIFDTRDRPRGPGQAQLPEDPARVIALERHVVDSHHRRHRAVHRQRGEAQIGERHRRLPIVRMNQIEPARLDQPAGKICRRPAQRGMPSGTRWPLSTISPKAAWVSGDIRLRSGVIERCWFEWHSAQPTE